MLEDRDNHEEGNKENRRWVLQWSRVHRRGVLFGMIGAGLLNQPVRRTVAQNQPPQDIAEQAIEELAPVYDEFEERLLNADWYSEQGEERAEAAVEEVNLPEMAVEHAVWKLLPKQLHPAAHAKSILDITRQFLNFYLALESSVIAAGMENTDNYNDLRENIIDLNSNIRNVRNIGNNARKRVLFEDRKELIEETYGIQWQYLHSTNTGSEFANPYSRTGSIGSTFGESVYETIRGTIELLRLYLITDYAATTAWLKNEERGDYLPEVFGRRMPAQRLDFSQKNAIYYDTLESGEDYTIYRIEMPEESDKESDLRITIGGPQIDGFEAILFESQPDSIDDPGGEELTLTTGQLSITTEDPSRENYYLLVKADETLGPYRVTATVYNLALGLIPWDHIAPWISVIEHGFSPETGPESVKQPDPVITAIEVPEGEIESGESVTITVRATNRGDPAEWQSIAISLPGITNTDTVTIDNHSLDYIETEGPGFEAGAEYGTTSVELEYLLIEGVIEDWEDNEEQFVELTIALDEEQSIYVKSLATASGVWESDPAIGETEEIDQQNEYVYEEIVSVEGAEDEDETGESSITVRLIDAETGEPMPDGTVTLMYFEQADDPFGPKSTDDDGVATYDGIDAEHPRRSGEYGVRGRAAGYGGEEERFTLEENRSVEITLELEPEEEVERSTLTVSVVDAETGDPVGTLPNVYVDHDGERIETARANDRGRARISLKDGREYTVSAVDDTGTSSEERTVTVNGDTEITLELNGEENTKTVWVPDPDSDSCSQMTVPADAHPDPAFETEEACLEYNGGFGGEDTAEETPSEDDADEGRLIFLSSFLELIS